MNQELKDFVTSFTGVNTKIEPLQQSGSDRRYYRFLKEDKPYILTWSVNISENETFFYFTQTFQNLNANVPIIYKISENREFYIQEDLGNESLLELQFSNPENAFSFYNESLKKLAHLQIGADQILDYNKAYDFKEFNGMLALRDLFYFKDYFLDFQQINYKQSSFLQECKTLANKVVKSNYRYFMYRDFQGRNILVHREKPFFIDYQGGMKGPILYDVASLLWQAKAQLNANTRKQLLSVYCNQVKKLIPTKFNQNKIQEDYKYCLLIRLLQVLGAYGKLGVIQNKPHFKQSIEFGLNNLKEYLLAFDLLEFPTIHHICTQLVEKETEF